MARISTIALVAVSFATTVRAQIVPPLGFDSWVFHGGSSCSPDPAANGTPDCAGSATGELIVDDRALPVWSGQGIVHRGGGTITPNQMRAFSSSNNGFHTVSTAVRDTYTLAGPAGDVEITVSLSAEADAMRLPVFNGALGGQPHGSANLSLIVGDDLWPDGRSVMNQIASASDGFPTATGALTQHLSTEASAPLTVTANAPFSLAYLMILFSVTGAEIDALNTASIDFDFPPEYTLTSELGWTPVPEPSAFLLLGFGAVGLISRRWRFRRRDRASRTT